MKLSNLLPCLALVYVAIVHDGRGQEPDQAMYTIGDLSKSTTDSQADIRLWAADHLGQISPHAPESQKAIERLKYLLSDTDVQVKSSAAAGLGNMGPWAGVEAAEKLFALLKDCNWQVQSSAAAALAQTGSAGVTTVPKVAELLWVNTSNCPKAAPVWSCWASPAADVAWKTRRSAAEVLGGLGPSVGTAAVDALNARVNNPDPDPSVRVSVAEALAKVHTYPGNAIPLLNDKLRHDPHDGVRQALAELLGKINPDGVEGPALQTVAATTEAVPPPPGSLSQSLTSAKAWLDEAQKKLDEADQQLRNAVSRVKALAAVPVLTDLLRDENAKVRVAAVESLAYFGIVVQNANTAYAEAPNSLPLASAALALAGSNLAAAEAGPPPLSGPQSAWLADAKRKLKDLQDRVNGKPGEIIASQEQALEQLQDAEATQIQEARHGIEQRLKDDDWTVRRAAWEALLRMRTDGAAARDLAFFVQPANKPAGQIIAPPVTVQVRDGNGKVATGDTSSVTLAICTGPAGVVLKGTLTRPVVNGVATFDDLSITTTGSYTLKATDGNFTRAKSQSFYISP